MILRQGSLRSTATSDKYVLVVPKASPLMLRLATYMSVSMELRILIILDRLLIWFGCYACLSCILGYSGVHARAFHSSQYLSKTTAGVPERISSNAQSEDAAIWL